MLRLVVRDLSISQASKLLARYAIRASISEYGIVLDGNISCELLEQLCTNFTIDSVQNFDGEILPIVCEEACQSTASEDVSDETVLETFEQTETIPEFSQTIEPIYNVVKRGEIYFCDFGTPYGHEQGLERPALVVQNDVGNVYSPTTIVLPLTTAQKNSQLTHIQITSSDIDLYPDSIQEFSVILAEHIMTVDKSRFSKYICTVTPEFMEKVQECIDISLQLRRKQNVIENEVIKYVPQIVYRSAPSQTVETIPRDLSLVQLKLLTLVDAHELFEIFESNTSNEEITTQILGLFGFDFARNGVQYLAKSILLSPKRSSFTLDTLCEDVSKGETDVPGEEIKRLIVARVKDTLHFKKSPTIDLIRLVNAFLKK